MTDAPTAAQILAEEDRLQLAAFDLDAAWTLGAHLRAIAAREGLPVAIEITHGTTPVFLSLLPGATPDNTHWLRRKRATVLRFQRSSLSMRLLCEERGEAFHSRFGLNPNDFVASGGALPLRVRGTGVVGVAAVSGLPDVEDHRLVVRALTELGLVPAA